MTQWEQYEQYDKDIFKYRKDYLDVLEEKYVNTDRSWAVIDIQTLTVVKNAGNRSIKSPKFGTLNSYYCEPAQKLIKERLKHSKESCFNHLQELSKHDKKNRTAHASTIHLSEGGESIVDSFIKSKGKKQPSMSDPILCTNPRFKQKISDCIEEIALGDKEKRMTHLSTCKSGERVLDSVIKSNEENMHCISQELNTNPCYKGKISKCVKKIALSDNLTTHSSMHKDVSIDDCSVSYRSLSKEQDDIINTPKPKNNSNNILDCVILCNKTCVVNELKIKRKINFNIENNLSLQQKSASKRVKEANFSTIPLIDLSISSKQYNDNRKNIQLKKQSYSSFKNMDAKRELFTSDVKLRYTNSKNNTLQCKKVPAVNKLKGKRNFSVCSATVSKTVNVVENSVRTSEKYTNIYECCVKLTRLDITQINNALGKRKAMFQDETLSGTDIPSSKRINQLEVTSTPLITKISSKNDFKCAKFKSKSFTNVVLQSLSIRESPFK